MDFVAKPPVIFNWPANTYTGWGVYGLNLLLNWARRTDVSIACAAPINRAHLALTPVERFILDDVLRASDALSARLAGVKGPARLSCLLLEPLGNGVLNQFQRPLTGTPSIGVIFLEAGSLDEAARLRAKAFPLIIAGSTWNREVMAGAGVGHVQTVLQGVDTTLFHHGPKTGLLGDRFVVFSGGKLERRKAQDLVLRGFRVFAQRHTEALLVAAWIAPSLEFAHSLDEEASIEPLPIRPDGTVDVIAWAQANGVATRQILDLGPVANPRLPRILRDADVALFPNRAEGGTNLVAMEAMACGVPAILSANTGHLDLIKDDNCFALMRQRPLPGPGCVGWGESDVDEIVETLETVYQDRAEARRRGLLGADMMSSLSWARQLDELATVILPYTQAS